MSALKPQGLYLNSSSAINYNENRNRLSGAEYGKSYAVFTKLLQKNPESAKSSDSIKKTFLCNRRFFKKYSPQFTLNDVLPVSESWGIQLAAKVINTIFLRSSQLFSYKKVGKS